jgi:S-adenosylmethionine hydrolase
MSKPVITLTTDFGHVDGYVGIMKGVILDICPEAVLVDITHEICPHSVHEAAYVLHTAAPYFPPGTVHLVVVDPGVGGARQPIVVQTQRFCYVAPDNGVLTMALAQDPGQLTIHLTEPRFRLPRISTTFHGRDIFAPAAAHLANGIDPREMGSPIPLSDLVTLPFRQPKPQANETWQAEILHIDQFGNLITNLQIEISDVPISIPIGQERITGLKRTFADVEPGELVAYVGSSGYLEIAVREGNAAAQLNLGVGDPVYVEGPISAAKTQPLGPSQAG